MALRTILTPKAIILPEDALSSLQLRVGPTLCGVLSHITHVQLINCWTVLNFPVFGHVNLALVLPVVMIHLPLNFK